MNQKNSTQLHPPTHHFSVLLSPTPRGTRLARLLAVEWLRTWDLPQPATEAAEHLVAELAANAATHGRLPGRDFRLALLARAATLRIEVTDTRGDDVPHRYPSAPAPDAESGRGLLLVGALADRWGVELGPVPRKTVWAELDLSPKFEPAGSGGSGALPQGTREGKKPHQAPPLPPTAHAHSRE
ncbi:ATP-binding protein [Streptomyces sp. AK04-3B]|uniref:ATP-binding protein n=1 Tax=Streptomyces sp. AK04-3B TaxID=3028650 RepID=UPI0029B87E34|nr:ATP-binding protein [Streptomyces sp. AK04-3B]MDX3804334.1 ATP-binding protein [Streptomyces sp. AK04-3B]